MIAAIDCGTNTIKLLIGDLPDVAVRESRMVRLGQDVDRTGRISDEAMLRAMVVLDEYAALVAAHPVERIRFCATSATRDSANAATFAEVVHQRLGVRPEVLSGVEEAALAYDGAVRNLRSAPAAPVLVVDIGGGSTELILGADEPSASASMDLGSVRLTERHLHADPASADQIAACVADIDATLDVALATSGLDPAAAATVVGVAGTTITVAAGVLDLPAYDATRTDQAEIAVADVHAYVARLATLSLEERRALPYLAPGRVDVIVGGALILDRVLRRTSVDTLLVSEADILDGIAWSIASPPG